LKSPASLPAVEDEKHDLQRYYSEGPSASQHYPGGQGTPKSLPKSPLFRENTPEYPRFHRRGAIGPTAAFFSKNVSKYDPNENSPRSWGSFSGILIAYFVNPGHYIGYYFSRKSGRFMGFPGDQIRESEPDTGPDLR